MTMTISDYIYQTKGSRTWEWMERITGYTKSYLMHLIRGSKPLTVQAANVIVDAWMDRDLTFHVKQRR